MATRAVSPTVSTVAKEDSLANNETLCVSFETNKAPRNNFFGTSSCAPTKHNDTTTFHAGIEAYKLLYISLPSVIVQFCVRSIFAQTASVVGRLVGVKSLAAFVLASMTANLSTQSVIMGALTAAETRMPRAYGTGHYRQVGVLAIQACFVCIVMLIVPVLILLTCMEIIFATLGQDPEASKLAIEWIRIYMLAIPFSLLFRVIQAFLNAQHVVLPLVLASVGACLVIHPLLLKAIMPTLGLWGSGLCIVLTQGIMVLLVLLYLYIRPESYNRETWPGLSRTLVLESLQPAPLWSFAKQSLGGVVSLSVSSDIATCLVCLNRYYLLFRSCLLGRNGGSGEFEFHLCRFSRQPLLSEPLTLSYTGMLYVSMLVPLAFCHWLYIPLPTMSFPSYSWWPLVLLLV